MSEFVRHTPVDGALDFHQISQRYRDRQEQVGGNEHSNVVEFSFMAHPLLNWMGDHHIGHPTTDYKRIEDEVNAIDRTLNSFLIFMGDEIDNLHWNPGQFEQMEQTPEQILFFWSIVQYMAQRHKLLLRIPGDHDGWLKKSGFDLQAMVRNEGVNTTNGPTHIVANVGDERYTGFAAHQLPGHSMYNRNHPQARSHRFGAAGPVDWIISNHNHQKSIQQSFAHTELGQVKPVTYIANGAYKPTDGWLQKKGYTPQIRTPEQMYGVSIMLDGKEHNIFVSGDIVEANDAFADIQQGTAGVNRLTPLKTGYNDEDMTKKWPDWDNFADEAPSENE
ncbi:MAG: hypothetical protein WC871_02420 [Bacteroidales bacterium]|jgi:hypothetical protein